MDAVDAAALLPLVGIHIHECGISCKGWALFFFMQHTQNLAVHKHSTCMFLLEKLLN